jgi:UTP--glucose-1-phosphate uridylyltransferase
MMEEELPSLAIAAFEYYYQRLVSGATGLIRESELTPIEHLPDAAQLDTDLAQAGRAALDAVVVLTLNGGLGTSMGLDRAKSLLTVKEGHTFLDITARQALETGYLLVLMNSFATDADSLKALEGYPELRQSFPLSFLQHKVPKIVRSDLSPAEIPDNPDLEWCPPGHGDLFLALQTSGMLEQLLAAGKRYAFVSNSDNLGGVLDPAILGFFISRRLPFLMEVTDRTEADRKGGHLARLRESGRLVLRESAQCPDEDLPAFQDVSRHRYFNTNNLWLDLEELSRVVSSTRFLRLPLIRNAKTVDPRDPESIPVYQLETAMGSAISLFEGAEAVRVPRARFAPVKTCNDLLTVRSDATVLTRQWRVEPSPARTLPVPPLVDLDPRFYTLVDDLEARFPKGPPSLVRCRSFVVRGDIRFEARPTLEGDVKFLNDSDRQTTFTGSTETTGEHRLS